MHRKILLWIVAFLAACEQPYPIEVDVATGKITVEGYIENGLPPLVMVSRSVNYYDTLSSHKLANLFVGNARVIIRDDRGGEWLLDAVTKSQLTPQLFPVLLAYLNGDWLPLMLSSDSLVFYTVRNGRFRGEIGRSYRLEVTVGSDTFRANTRILPLPQIDSMIHRFDTISATNEVLATMFAHLYDPLGPNYYRQWVRIGNAPFYPTAGASVFDDASYDGREVWFPFNPGHSVYDDDSFDIRRFFFQPGDTVTLKVASIDRPAYIFYRNLEFHMRNRNSFNATPIYIPTNVEKGRGLFVGLGAVYFTYVIPQ